MFQALKSMWALFFGITVLWFGTGMMFNLLVIRANAEGFSTVQIGFMQTTYQLGWIAAAFFAARMIHHVGHIRVFSAMVAAGSAIILLHLMYINPWIWSIERLKKTGGKVKYFYPKVGWLTLNKPCGGITIRLL